MELPEIEKLLLKYFEAETTIQEEKVLTNYFRNEQVAPHLEKHKILFSFYDKERALTSQSDTRYLLNAKKQNKSWYSWVGIAATILLAAGLFSIVQYTQTNQQDLGTYEDPEIALQKTKEVLSMVSRFINDGTEELQYLNEFEKTKNKLIR